MLRNLKNSSSSRSFQSRIFKNSRVVHSTISVTLKPELSFYGERVNPPKTGKFARLPKFPTHKRHYYTMRDNSSSCVTQLNCNREQNICIHTQFLKPKYQINFQKPQINSSPYACHNIHDYSILCWLYYSLLKCVQFWKFHCKLIYENMHELELQV